MLHISTVSDLLKKNCLSVLQRVLTSILYIFFYFGYWFPKYDICIEQKCDCPGILYLFKLNNIQNLF